ncbi:antifungal protein ginkbilobin-like protein [Jatropha curcas]|nr:antifungal protein ginkbilobin-like protein [Jatropha curcas]
MGLPQKLAAKIIIVFFLQFCSNRVTSIPNTQVLTVLCNSGVYSKGDPFGISLDYVVKELETVTPTTKNYDFYNISPYPNAFAYGHAVCNQNLTNLDCETCLGAAKSNMFSTCQNRIGARSVLHDCSIRYEQYPFTD